MSERPEPALTPEDVRFLREEVAHLFVGTRIDYVDGLADRLKALLGLFTWEDVDIIRHALSRWDGLGYVGEGEEQYLDTVSDKFSERAYTVADRLEKILPPREET